MPKTPGKMDEPQRKVVIERTVEKTIIRRCTISGQSGSQYRRRDMYQELKQTTKETRTISEPIKTKVVFTCNNIEQLRANRESFKKLSDEARKKYVAKFEAERQRKLDEVQKLQEINNLGREVLRDISTLFNQTETVMQQTLNHCRLMCQQIGQTKKQMEDLNVKESTLNKTLKDLQR